MEPLQTIPYATVVQITDSHLFADLEGRLLGMNTQESLQRVAQLVENEQRQPDLLLCTGDISQDGSAESYQRFASMANRFAAPVRWVAGNHDERLALQQASLAASWVNPVYDLGAWRVITLDTSVANEVHGYLDQEQLSILENALQSAGERHVLIALHHHPVPIHSHWMDQINLHNAADMLAIIAEHSNVKAVLWGHVHQEFDAYQDGVRWLACPSTCIQFAPRQADFTLDEKAPGYRWLRLYEDGQIQTAVSRVETFKLEIDRNSNGY